MSPFTGLNRLNIGFGIECTCIKELLQETHTGNSLLIDKVLLCCRITNVILYTVYKWNLLVFSPMTPNQRPLPLELNTGGGWGIVVTMPRIPPVEIVHYAFACSPVSERAQVVHRSLLNRSN